MASDGTDRMLPDEHRVIKERLEQLDDGETYTVEEVAEHLGFDLESSRDMGTEDAGGEIDG